MKKVTNATLGGIVFAVEEDAYEALSKYLKSIEVKFVNSPDYSEISADIESAIAEKFKLRKKSDKIAITKIDVDEVVREMGTADEVGEVADDQSGRDEKGSDNSTSQLNASSVNKRLYRNTDDSIIGGVASGLAQYFDIDPVIVRVLFVVAFFFSGFGLLVYIILWLIVPAAKTTTDKYAMRGENMTVADITERVKKNLNDEENITRVKGVWGSVRRFFVGFFEIVKTLFRGLMYILRYVVGAALVVAAAVGVAGLVFVTSVFWMPGNTFVDPLVNQITAIVMQEGIGVFLVISGVVVLFIPLLVIIMLGASLFAGRNFFTVAKSVSLFVVWIMSLALVSSFAVFYGPKFVNDVHDAAPELFMEGVERFEMDWDNDKKILIHVSDKNRLGHKIEVYDGVRVYKDIEQLDLSEQGLSGSLKSEIRHLSDLKYVDLSNNDFTGLPAEIGQLSDLETLMLKNNEFTGLPHELGNLENLKYLDLSGNAISVTDVAIIMERLPNVVVVIE